ncbi:MAG TPA: VanZ family protein [Thermoanaerobaculia bacterium]|nr:VanZ family protein [Thermoanaerobaculia bacterium]
MGKRQVRLIVVPKFVSAFLLLLTTAAMLSIIYLLSGRAYATESTSPLTFLLRWPLSGDHGLAIVMPLIADLMFFLPWGFLLFMVLDTPSRPRRMAYAIVGALALLLASTIHLWQIALPSRVTTAVDAILHSVGALCGAALGQMRKDIRVRFDY